MAKTKQRPTQKHQIAALLSRPPQSGFRSAKEARRVWLHGEEPQAHHAGPDFHTWKPVVQIQIPKEKQAELPTKDDPHLQRIKISIKAIRSAQLDLDHAEAIKHSAFALQEVRQIPSEQRSAYQLHILELLNLRSISLIAVGEIGSAWRCIRLMAKLWTKT